MTMKALTKTAKMMLDALAHADAGEYLTPREKTRVLAGQISPRQTLVEAPAPAIEETGSSARRVALYLGSELPGEVMDYVIQTCGSLQHNLTVLTFESENTARALLQPHKGALENAGVEMKLVTLSGEQPMMGLNRYLRRHPEIAFLACKDSGYLGHLFMKGMQNKNALPVPVVVVTTDKKGAGSAGQPAADHKDQDAVA
jgi:hypothetical protein